MKNRLAKVLYYTWLVIFVLLPILLVIVQSFFDVNGHFSLENYYTFFSSIYLKMTLNSFLYASIITFICIVLAYPLAFGLSKLKHAQFWLVLFMIPSWINLLLKTYAFMGILGEHGIISQITQLLTGSSVDLLFTITGFIIVSVYIFLPFTIMPLVNGFLDINHNIIRAGYDLGATSLQVFWRLYLPLTKQALYSAIQIVFIPTLSIFMITRLIAGNRIITLGTAIQEHFLTTGNWGMGSTIGTILIIILCISIFLLNTNYKSKKKIKERDLIQGGGNA